MYVDCTAQVMKVIFGPHIQSHNADQTGCGRPFCFPTSIPDCAGMPVSTGTRTPMAYRLSSCSLHVVPYLNMPISSENCNPVLEHTVSFDMIIMVTNRMMTCDLSDAEVSDTIARITVC